MLQDPPELHQIFDIVWEECRAIVNMVMNSRVLQMIANISTS
jgi:hypothetical protein